LYINLYRNPWNSLHHRDLTSVGKRCDSSPNMPAALGFTEAKSITEDGNTEFTRSNSASILEGTKEDHGADARLETECDRQVHELVRKFTAQSEQQNMRASPFSDDAHPRLDPKNEQFRAKDWAQAFYNLRYSGDEAIPRVAGVAFKNLNVWGKGSPTDFQSTVGNTILKLPSLFGRGTKRIEILRDLDGLLLPGEQLCVLGPPG
jgi:ATP-binding cassette subfamily G (WHITE) protein 2 (PDR)